MRQAWNSYYAQYGKVAGTKSDGSWDNEQALADIGDVGIISGDLINDETYCINGMIPWGEYKQCKDYGLYYAQDSNWDNNYTVSSMDDTSMCGKIFDEELDRAIDKKLDDGDPDTGRMRAHKMSNNNYDWTAFYFLLDL